MPYLTEQIAIAAFPLGKDTPVMSLSRDLVQWLYRLLQEFALLLAAI
jgi:hypothetical protein